MTSAFGYTDYVSDGTIAAGDESSGLPATNLGERIVQQLWRSGTSTTTYFTVDFGSAVPIQLLALFGCTLASADTVRHRLSAVASGNSELYDSGVVACGVDPLYGAHADTLTAEVSPRYWRCDIVAASRSVEGYFDIGRAWAGELWEPSANFSLGWGEGFDDTAQIDRSRHSGVAFASEGASFRVIDVTYDVMSEADRTQALTIEKALGKRTQFVFMRDTGALETAMLSRVASTSMLRQPNDASTARYSKTYSLQQEL